jgi:hypothetical protein
MLRMWQNLDSLTLQTNGFNDTASTSSLALRHPAPATFRIATHKI